MKISITLGFFILSFSVFSKPVNWGRDHRLSPGESRHNIYAWNEAELKDKTREGKIHALWYPVEPTIRIPEQPFRTLFSQEPRSFFKRWLMKLAKNWSGLQSFEDIYDYINLHSYPKETQPNPSLIPYPEGFYPDYPMGATLKEEALTFSCAACHAGNLFGDKILGLTNRFPKANDLFVMAKKTVPLMPGWLFKRETGANEKEMQQYQHLREALGRVGVKKPKHPSLDTSLAQVALSLVRRNNDAYATPSKEYQRKPRASELVHLTADSKPAVWWNLKYKNRWLSDGSIISGNPIFTNFLWNEIGRGADLEELEVWLRKNEETIEELTTSVFATEAPHITDYFDFQKLDLKKAQRGEKLFLKNCSSCHGRYVKNWSLEGEFTQQEKLKTAQVFYHQKTPVKDVGTDPGRYQGMKDFAEKLNALEISKWMGTVVEPQKGYVPPPLVGIWARWPYFHNNSIPNLCELLTVESKRAKTFYTGPALDKKQDYDFECGGYPLKAVPSEWKENKERLFDTTIPGLSNRGHSKILLNSDGREKFSQTEKMDLIEFLKTL